MEEYSNQSQPDTDKPLFIFIGEKISSSEIQILQIPTFYDALQLTGKHSSVKESPNYQYLSLESKKQIHYNYMDGNEKTRGRVALNKDQLEILSEHPLQSFLSYLMIKTGNKLTFLTIPPNNKIKLRKKDTVMHHAQTKKLE